METETDRLLADKKKSRNRYINEAIAFYNRLQKRKILSKQLAKESKVARDDSVDVLAEFERLSDEDQAV